jgi:predicted RNA-binding Zn ribbon-like protein
MRQIQCDSGAPTAVDNTSKTIFAGCMALPYNVSRAGSLHLLAGQLALDFANTASGRGSPTHQEHLRTPLNVLEWACHAQVLTEQQLRRLRTSMPPPLLLKRATRLRDLIHEIAEPIAQGREASAKALSSLSSLYARALTHARLSPAKPSYAWTWQAAPNAVLGPILQAAVDMMLSLDHTRIKQCAGHECGWLFYDETKNNSRRWCDMKVCGNRAKTRAARKRKAAPQ